MKELPLSVGLILLAMIVGFSQGDKKSVVIGEMITRPNAILVLNPPNGNQGFLLPQLPSANRQLIAPTSPDEDGLVVFDTTEKSFYYWNDGQWIKGLGEKGEPLTFDPATNKLSINGNSIDLSTLKEIPSPANGDPGRLLTTDGTALNWTTLSDLGDITTILAGAGLSGGGATGEVTLNVNTDNTTISVNGFNELQLSDLSVTQNKVMNGAITSAKLNTTGVVAGLYGNNTQVAQVYVDAQGRITNAANVTITGALPIGAAGGDLTGTYPDPTIASNAIGSTEIGDNTITSADISDGTISNADINAGAAIDVNKLAAGTDGQVLSVVGTVPTWTTTPALTLQSSFYTIDPSDFQMLKSDGKPDKNGMAIFETNNTFVTAARDNEGENIMASVHLPHGATLTQMIIYYWDNGPENITVSLLRKNLATGANTVIATFTSSLSSAVIRTQTITQFGGMDVIANDIYSYRILVNFDIAGNVDSPAQARQRMYGIRLEYLH